MTSELEDLEHLVDLANKVVFTGQPAGTKVEALATVSRVLNKVHALDASILTAFEATKENQPEGHGSPIGWLKHHTRARGPDASRRRRLARALRGMPLAEKAMTAGELSVEHIEVLARAQHLVGDEIFTLLEEPLVDAAAEMRFLDFAQTVEYAVVRARPADAEDRAEQQIENRYASSSRTMDGCGKVDAWMPPLAFTEWQAELARLCDHLLEEDRAEARARLGRRPLRSELRRTSRKRRVDAMLPGPSGPPPALPPGVQLRCRPGGPVRRCVRWGGRSTSPRRWRCGA